MIFNGRHTDKRTGADIRCGPFVRGESVEEPPRCGIPQDSQ
jgi:hypothetical protein